MSRTVVVCLDGGDPTVIHELIAAGRLPSMAALTSRGSRVHVRDTLGRIMDLSVWAPILSGRPPGDHALAHFEEFDPVTMGTLFRREGTLEPLWNHLPARGAGALVLDPPEMHVHAGSAAAQSCGWHSHAPAHAPVITDAGLAARLAARGRPPALANVTSFGRDTEVRAAQQLVASAAFRRATVEALGLDRAFTLLGVHELHTAVHALGHHGPYPHWLVPEIRDPELLARVYVAVDEVLGTVIRLAGDDANIVLVATRGIRAADHSGHLLEGLLERAGLLVLRAEAGGEASASDRGARAAELLRGLVPAELRERVALRVLPEAWQHQLAARRFRDHFAWERTRAFPCPTWSSGLIRLNVQGRESRGIVPPEEAEPLLRQIEGLLVEVQDADTGRPLIEEVFRPAERFPGELARRWPDLVMTWAGGRPARAAHHPRLGTWTAPDAAPVWTEHGTELEVTLAGPGIRPGVSIDATGTGFAPTVLTLAAAPAPFGLPGTPWADVLAA